MEKSAQVPPQQLLFQGQPLHALRLPRYTSYPPASEFKLLAGGTHESWLQNLPQDKPVSLYVHIPFCRELCWFCGCFTTITQHDAPIQRYVDLLIDEIRWVCETTGRLAVSHLHFGGGSPTALLPQDFSRIIQALRAGFDFLSDTEIAVEIDPRTIDQDKIDTYADCGVNRASLGVQDFDAKVQLAVHRIQPYELVDDVVQRLRNSGISQINFDLMYGLPYQTVDSVAQTARQALTLQPARLSVFGYAHVPWMRKHQQVLDELPMADPDTRVSMFDTMRAVFVEHDYVPIGIDHYAQKDDALTLAMRERRLKRNFQGYTTDQAETLLAFGLSAISSLPQGYAQNTSRSQEYKQAVSQRQSPAQRGLTLSDDDKLRREMISELMCHYQVDLREAAERHGLKDDFGTELQALQPFFAQHLLSLDGGKLTITATGRRHVRAICAMFDRYLDHDGKRFSLAV